MRAAPRESPTSKSASTRKCRSCWVWIERPVSRCRAAPIPGELASAVSGFRRFIWPTNRCEVARGALAPAPRTRPFPETSRRQPQGVSGSSGQPTAASWLVAPWRRRRARARSRRARVGRARVSAVHLANQPLRAGSWRLGGAAAHAPTPGELASTVPGCQRFIWPTNRCELGRGVLATPPRTPPLPESSRRPCHGCRRFIWPTNRSQPARGALAAETHVAGHGETNPSSDTARLASASLPETGRPPAPPRQHEALRASRCDERRAMVPGARGQARRRTTSDGGPDCRPSRRRPRPAPTAAPPRPFRPAASGAPGRGRRSGPPDPRCRRRAGSRRR